MSAHTPASPRQMSQSMSDRVLFERLVPQGDWVGWALCTDTDPDLWFPEQGDRSAHDKARRICADCPVRTECLNWAIETHEPFGIWGGVSARERTKLWGAA